MAKFKLNFAEECTCDPGKEYGDGTRPLYFQKEQDAIDKLLWFMSNYAYFKETERKTGTGKWLYKEHYYWGIHLKVGDRYKHALSLRPA